MHPYELSPHSANADLPNLLYLNHFHSFLSLQIVVQWEFEGQMGGSHIHRLDDVYIPTDCLLRVDDGPVRNQAMSSFEPYMFRKLLVAFVRREVIGRDVEMSFGVALFLETK